MKIKKNPNYTLTLIFSLISLLLLTNVPFLSNTNTQNYQEQGEAINETPHSAGFWVLDFIHVDDNWTATAGQGWCKEENGVYIIENVTIDAGDTRSCILIENTDEPFLIKNCTLLNSGPSGSPDDAGACIKMVNVSNGLIFNNTLKDSTGDGIILYDESEENEILNNTITENYYGILIHSDCLNNTIKYNLFEDQNRDAISIYHGSNNNTISNNQMKNNLYYGIYETGCSNNKFLENKISGNRMGVWSYNSENTKIKDNDIFGNYGNAIKIDHECLYISIIHNNIYDNNQYSSSYAGILVETSSNYTKILDNDIFNTDSSTGQDYGIVVQFDCHNTSIFRNTIYNNSENGISILEYINDTTIILNKIYNNSKHGIYLVDEVFNTTITKNTLENNTLTGVDIGDGTVKGSTIYFNCFKNNGLHARDLGAYNQWYNNSKGNYWDNYTGSDAGNDGIGDVPYNISQSPLIQDLYPLMECPDFTESSEPIIYSLSFEAFLSHGFKRAYKRAIVNAYIRAFERILRRLAREHNITISTETSLHANIQYNQNIPKQANSFSYFGILCSFTYILVESVSILNFLRKRVFVFTQKQFPRFKYFI